MVRYANRTFAGNSVVSKGRQREGHVSGNSNGGNGSSVVYGNFCGIGYTLGISVLVVLTKFVGLVAESSRVNMRTAVKIFMHEASQHGFIDS